MKAIFKIVLIYSRDFLIMKKKTRNKNMSKIYHQLVNIKLSHTSALVSNHLSTYKLIFVQGKVGGRKLALRSSPTIGSSS